MTSGSPNTPAIASRSATWKWRRNTRWASAITMCLLSQRTAKRSSGGHRRDGAARNAGNAAAVCRNGWLDRPLLSRPLSSRPPGGLVGLIAHHDRLGSDADQFQPEFPGEHVVKSPVPIAL